MINSKLENKLQKNEFVITSELSPPKGIDLEAMNSKVNYMKPVVDAVNVSDLQGSNMSLGALAASHILLDSGIEPVMQITCRDRNRLALQSDLLSAYVLGIRNILVLTGDHPVIGDNPEAKPVFDIDSVQLLWTIQQMENGFDLSGNKLNESPIFFKGAAVKVECDTEETFQLQILKMKKKIDCGAQFFQTMPIFSKDSFERFLEKVNKLNIDIPVIAGIQLIKSEKMALYMNKNIPGICVPEDIIDKIKHADDKVSTSINIAAAIINDIKSLCSGIHIGAQGWEHHIPRLLKESL